MDDKWNTDTRSDTDFLRAIAICLIINSHMDVIYPVRGLATGGAIGNALFFMLSSYGLTISYSNKARSYKEYLMQRIKRIYPPIWGELIVLYIPYKIIIDHYPISTFEWSHAVYYLGCYLFPMQHWFISTLLVYYIIAYPLLKKGSESKIYMSLLMMVPLYVYLYMNHVDRTRWSVEASYAKYVTYYVLFLMGIIVARARANIVYAGLRDWAVLILLLAAMYFQKYLMTHNSTLAHQYAQSVILLPISVYLFKISRSNLVQQTILGNQAMTRIIRFISQRTLEIYIVHEYVIYTVDHYAVAYPLNIILIVALIPLGAYLLKMIVARYIEGGLEKLAVPAQT